VALQGCSEGPLRRPPCRPPWHLAIPPGHAMTGAQLLGERLRHAWPTRGLAGCFLPSQQLPASGAGAWRGPPNLSDPPLPYWGLRIGIRSLLSNLKSPGINFPGPRDGRLPLCFPLSPIKGLGSSGPEGYRAATRTLSKALGIYQKISRPAG